jgi:hypothetical protein
MAEGYYECDACDFKYSGDFHVGDECGDTSMNPEQPCRGHLRAAFDFATYERLCQRENEAKERLKFAVANVCNTIESIKAERGYLTSEEQDLADLVLVEAMRELEKADTSSNGLLQH